MSHLISCNYTQRVKRSNHLFLRHTFINEFNHCGQKLILRTKISIESAPAIPNKVNKGVVISILEDYATTIKFTIVIENFENIKLR